MCFSNKLSPGATLLLYGTELKTHMVRFMKMLIIIAILVTLLFLFYKYWVNGFHTWKERGIPFLPASFPFGTDWELSTFRRFQGFIQEEMCKKAAEYPLFGIHTMRTPMLIVKDPELIRIILTKEFSHFQDRLSIKLPENDHLSHHLVNLNGEKWRALRVKLSPTFTSGKMKAMFPLFVSCAEVFNSVLLSNLDEEVDIKDLAGRFTTDIICSCAFGLDVKTLLEPDNKLREIGLNFFKIKFSLILKIALVRAIPQLRSVFMTRFTPLETEKYLMKLVEDTIEYREKNGVNRNDFMDLLIQLRNQKKLNNEKEDPTNHSIEMTTGLMAAQCFVFFVAGFETSSSVQTYCLYELALNQDIQQKLRTEIDKTIQRHGEFTYEAMKEMEYLDMVISETLRKYPTTSGLTRICKKPYTTPSGHRIEVNDRILIPVWALHHDAKYFPDPEKFDPERFSTQKKNSITPFTYLPFGEGPRMCIGIRFGLLQTKMGIATILRNYQVEPCKATKIPLEFKATIALTSTKQPIILKLVKRTSA